eukprot:gene12832-12960_t
MNFLTEEEREALQCVMDEQASQEKVYDEERSWRLYWAKTKAALRNPVTLTSAAWNFFYLWAYYGIIYWAPMLVNAILQRPLMSKSHIDITAVLLTAIPFGAAAVWQVVYSWHSQKRDEKKYHLIASYGAAGLLMALLPTVMKLSIPGAFAVIILCAMFVYGGYSISNSYIYGLLGAERGMGGAIFNSLGNLGGFVGPYVIGAAFHGTGSHAAGMYVMAAGLFTSCIVIGIYQPRWSEAKAMPHAASSADVKGVEQKV